MRPGKARTTPTAVEISGEQTVSSLRYLSKSLKRHGVTRSHAALGNIVKDPRWYDAGFNSKAPWPEKQLPAMARWIDENLQQDRSREELEEIAEKRRKKTILEDKDFATASLDDIEKLIDKKGLAKVTEFAKLKRLIEQAENERLDRQIKEKTYVKAEAIEQGDAKKREAIKRGLERLAQALRQVLADTTDPGRVEEILTGAFRKLCNEGFGGKW